MARPQKEGLEYFPLDVDIDQDDKLVVPIAKHGMLGFGVIIKLMMEVYKNGYYYPWTEKESYVFPFKIGVEAEKVNEIIIDCINSGFFCNNQFNRNQILTSYGFQKRFLMAASRRKDATINERYLVKKELLKTETELLPTKTKEMSAESTQSKVKESKSNKTTKEVGSSCDAFRLFQTEGFGTISSVIKDDITDMIETYSEPWVCEAMKVSVLEGKRKLSYVRGILKNWLADGIDEPWIEQPQQKPKSYDDHVIELNRRKENTVEQPDPWIFSASNTGS